MRTAVIALGLPILALVSGGAAPAEAQAAPVTTLVGIAHCTSETAWVVDWTYKVKAPRSVKTKHSVAAMHSDGTDSRVIKGKHAGSWVARWSTPGQNWSEVSTRFAGRQLDVDTRLVPPPDCGGPVTGRPVPPVFTP